MASWRLSLRCHRKAWESKQYRAGRESLWAVPQRIESEAVRESEAAAEISGTKGEWPDLLSNQRGQQWPDMLQEIVGREASLTEQFHGPSARLQEWCCLYKPQFGLILC